MCAPGYRGRDDLLALEVGGDEDVRLEPERRGLGGDGAREVARRRARERLEPELEGLGGRDRHDPVLERVGRVRGLDLDVQLAQAERLGETRRRDERRQADGQASGRRRGDGQEIDVAPERPRPGLDPLAGERATQRVEVVGRLERARGRCRTTGARQGDARHHSGCRPAQSRSREAPLGVRHGHICRARRESDPLDLAPGAPRTGGAPGCRGFTGPVPSASLDAAPSRASGSAPQTLAGHAPDCNRRPRGGGSPRPPLRSRWARPVVEMTCARPCRGGTSSRRARATRPGTYLITYALHNQVISRGVPHDAGSDAAAGTAIGRSWCSAHSVHEPSYTRTFGYPSSSCRTSQVWLARSPIRQ